MADRAPFSLAGIWERWHGGDGGVAIDTFALITTEPNSVAALIHNRMPVIVALGDYEAWLG